MGQEYKKVVSGKKQEAKQLMSPSQLKKCHAAIHTAAVASAAAGFVPVPGVDAIPISAAQVTMVLALGSVFGQKMTESTAKGILGATASTFIGRNLVKFIPVAGWMVAASVAAGVTEALGWTIAVDFANSAKKRGEQDSEIDKQVEDLFDETENESEEDIKQTIITGLKTRASEFLLGDKDVKLNRAEYDALIKDFEYVLDDLEVNDPLRKAYENLFKLV